MEALNSLIQAAKRKARGYRQHDTFRRIAFLIAGKLDMRLPTLR
jgi:transposase